MKTKDEEIQMEIVDAILSVLKKHYSEEGSETFSLNDAMGNFGTAVMKVFVAVAIASGNSPVAILEQFNRGVEANIELLRSEDKKEDKA